MQAMYLVKESIEDTIQGVTGTPFAIYAGRGAVVEGNRFGTYKIIPNVTYDQPYLHTDGMQVDLYFPVADDLYRCLEAILEDLNQESMVGHIINQNPDDVRFHDIITTVSSSDEFSLIGEDEVFQARLGIVGRYVKL